MLTLCRMLAVVATLFSAVPAEIWAGAERPCLQATQDAGDHEEPCDDESPACGSCFCCHLRAAPFTGCASLVAEEALVERVMTLPTLGTPQPSLSGVFHPPRA